MISFPIYLMVPVLILIEGIFAGSEIALLSSDRLELKKRARKGSYGAQLALSLTEKPERILSTIVGWGRFAELFGYNKDEDRFYLDNE